MNQRYANIATLVSYDGPLPVQVAPDLFFDRATPKQAREYRMMWKRLAFPVDTLHPPYFRNIDIYDTEARRAKTADGERIVHNPLGESRWNYWVFRTSGSNEGDGRKDVFFWDIDDACALHPKKLMIGMKNMGDPDQQVVKENPQTFFTSTVADTLPVAVSALQGVLSGIFKLKESPYPMGYRDLDIKDLELLSDIMKDLSDFDKEKFPNLYKAIRGYTRLFRLDHDSILLDMNRFIIIESLLLDENAIQRPGTFGNIVASKYQLLLRRMKHKPVFPEHILANSSVEIPTIVRKAFVYRNKIAHAQTPDFTGKLDVLKDQSAASKVADELVRTTILAAIREPQLVQDLKAC